MQFEGGQELVDVGVDTEVDHLESGAFEHHCRQVLADVVDVAFDRADDHLADRLRAGLGQEWTQDAHARLHRIGGQQHLGHEQDPVAEVDADDAHALDECVVEHLVRAPSTVEQDGRAFEDLVGQAVVQIVVHLGDEVRIAQRGEVEIVLFTHGVGSVCYRAFHDAESTRIVEQPIICMFSLSHCRSGPLGRYTM